MIIDLSSNNGVVIWQQTKSNPTPIEGVILKVNEGNGQAFIDSKVSINANGAKQCGYKIGYYHFATLNDAVNVTADAQAEADFFIQCLQTLPKADYPHALDIETNKANLMPLQVLEWINAFFTRLETKGIHDYDIYSYADFLNRNLPSNHDLGARIRLWLAGYTAKPTLPTAWKTAYAWQYTSTGKIMGINGNVDCSKLL
jgi:GH25 family lysozyme M1 (1,4-beta-N-acetylmuramidase)